MDAALLEAWRSAVGTDDVIICAGDVALAGALGRKRLAVLAGCPGRKLLVRGNHDFSRSGLPAAAGTDQAAMTLLLPGDPPLVVTHMPRCSASRRTL